MHQIAIINRRVSSHTFMPYNPLSFVRRVQEMTALGAERLHKKFKWCHLICQKKKLNVQGGVNAQLLTYLPPLLKPFEPHPFFQLSANSSSLVIPHLSFQCSSQAAQTTSPTPRLRLMPSKQTDMCFTCRRGTKVLYLVTGAASSSILPSGKLTNYIALFISKKRPKQNKNKPKTSNPSS